MPEGTEVACCSWVVQRDPGVYGPDAEAFRPGRWLETEDQARDYANKYSLTFGYGARACLGKALAFMELCKAPLQFMRMFRPRPAAAPTAAEGAKPNPGGGGGGEEEGGDAGSGFGRYVYKGGISYWEDMWITIDRRAPVV